MLAEHNFWSDVGVFGLHPEYHFLRTQETVIQGGCGGIMLWDCYLAGRTRKIVLIIGKMDVANLFLPVIVVPVPVQYILSASTVQCKYSTVCMFLQDNMD